MFEEGPTLLLQVLICLETLFFLVAGCSESAKMGQYAQKGMKNYPESDEVFKSQIKKTERGQERAQPLSVGREMFHCKAAPKLGGC